MVMRRRRGRSGNIMGLWSEEEGVHVHGGFV